MPDTRPMARSIRVLVPARFKLDRDVMADWCGWRIKKRDGDFLIIQTEEGYFGTAPRLISAERAATAANAADPQAYEPFRRFTAQDPYADDFDHLRKLSVEYFENSATAVEAWGSLRGMLTACKDSELVPYLQAVWAKNILEQYPDSSVWAVLLSSRLSSRLAIMRSLAAAAETPELLERSGADFRGFSGASGLMPSLRFGQEAFIEPALIVSSPWSLGWLASRTGGAVAILFGRPVASSRSHSQMLDLHRVVPWPGLSSHEGYEQADVSAAVIEGWFSWWMRRLDVLLGMVTDPTRFPDEAGDYDPRQHQALLLGLVRLFLAVQGILTHPHDHFVRMSLFFDAIDILHGLRLGHPERLTRPDKLRKDLAVLHKELPAEAAEMALPLCALAVDALESVKQGFFVKERLTDETIRMPRADGGHSELSINVAVARYLRVVRNSHHGYGEMARENPQAMALLASHDGSVPPALPDIAFVHLLSLLVRPERLFAGQTTARADRRDASR